MYSERVKEAFLKPKHMGKMKKPDAIGTVGNIVCGDVMHLYIKVGKNKKGKEYLKDVKWETFGCAAAIATSSTVSDIAVGKTLREAIDLSNESVVSDLGGLPKTKIHCSVLAIDALHEAIYNYLSEENKEIPKKLGKKHQKIQSEMKELKEKYHDFIEAQEKMRQSEKANHKT